MTFEMASLGYYLLLALAYLFFLVPFWVLYRLSDLLYIWMIWVGYRKKTVFENLSRAFPEKTPPEIRKISRRFYRHFCDFILENLKTMSMPVRVQSRRFVYLNYDLIDRLRESGRSFVLVSGHYNNWEWSTLFNRGFRHPFLVIYRTLHNRSIDRLMRTLRQRHGIILIPMEQIFREAIARHQQKQLFAVWFLADQRPPKSSKCWIRFLNQETAFFEGAEKMSRKLNMAVVFMHISKLKRGHYGVEFKLLAEEAGACGENQITLAFARELEERIRAVPEFWLWSHRRFKHSRPPSVPIVE